jgi:hypothetical protein
MVALNQSRRVLESAHETGINNITAPHVLPLTSCKCRLRIGLMLEHLYGHPALKKATERCNGMEVSAQRPAFEGAFELTVRFCDASSRRRRRAYGPP